MHEKDSIQRFIFDNVSIRGEIIHLNSIYQKITQQRPYPLSVRLLLGEALLSCSLLAASIKFEGEISLQFHGDRRLPLLLVQCDNQLNLRAFAKYQDDDGNVDYNAAFLQGKMVININQFNQTQTYQSVVPIHSISMGENLMHYLAQSEQIPSQVCLAVNEKNASGILLQLMPGQNTLQRENFWEYAVHIGQTITHQELFMLDNETILHRLYHETDLRLYDARSLYYNCRCSFEKMKQVLVVLGKKDVQQLIEEKGKVKIYCDFCNQGYNFDAIDVTLLFSN